MRNVHIGWGPVGMTKIKTQSKPKLRLSKSNYTGELNSEFKLDVISEIEGIPVWQSSNEAVAKVDQEGNVTLLGEGTAIITVTLGELTSKCTIKVVLSEEQKFIRDLQKGGNVKLTSNITLTTPVSIKNTVILDLNNHDIVVSAEGQDAIWVLTGGNLTINGNGNVIGTYYSLYAGGNAQVVINGGNYVGVGAAIYAQSTAVVEINAGRFEANNEDPNYKPHDYTLNLKDGSSAKILVKGGEFYNFNPADCVSEGPNTNFVVNGYESIETKPGIWEVRKAQSKLDNTKIYYGVIPQAESFESFSMLTEDIVIKAIGEGTMKSANLVQTEIPIIVNTGEVITMLIPGNIYNSGILEIDGSKRKFADIMSGTQFHANGDITIGDFRVFGQWVYTPGKITVYVQ